MRIRIAAAWARLRGSFWFIPLLLILLAAALAVAVPIIEANIQPCEIYGLQWLCYPGELAGARILASMIAGEQPLRLLATATFHYADIHVSSGSKAGADDLDAALAAGFQTRLPGWNWTESSPFDGE